MQSSNQKFNHNFNLSADSDTLYQQLLDAHAELSEQQSAQLNARLILLMMNQIGDSAIIQDIIQAAKQLNE